MKTTGFLHIPELLRTSVICLESLLQGLTASAVVHQPDSLQGRGGEGAPSRSSATSFDGNFPTWASAALWCVWRQVSRPARGGKFHLTAWNVTLKNSEAQPGSAERKSSGIN